MTLDDGPSLRDDTEGPVFGGVCNMEISKFK